MSFPVRCVFTPTQLSFQLKISPKALQTNNHNISFDAEYICKNNNICKSCIFDSYMTHNARRTKNRPWRITHDWTKILEKTLHYNFDMNISIQGCILWRKFFQSNNINKKCGLSYWEMERKARRDGRICPWNFKYLL